MTLPTLAGPVTEIRILAGGGPSGRAVEQAYIKPFTAKNGVKVVRETLTAPPLGALRAIVASGHSDAVLLEVGGPGVAAAKRLGLIEPLDWAAIDPAPLYPEARDTHALGYQYFSVAAVWRADAKPIATWRDFWDVAAFPGRRSLPDNPYYALPIALLADGVPPEQLYPLDLDRAFRSLQRLEENVAVWWSTGQQPVQLLLDNEVQYAAAYSGRAVRDPRLRYTFNQGLLAVSYFVVPKGAPPEHKSAAWKLLHEMTLPQNQAVAAGIVSYTGSSTDLDSLLPADRLAEFPTARENRQKQIPANDQYWSDHSDMVEQRWQEFKLGL
ncbi:extracellular solute-binding protein [Labrys wisconsinensis]|uniref:Spermidine/putrescine transport system substrate-binding protein n=1 Tax=Labrys wisconsinensis TaxID=425677 RepID=A0ABU0J9W0_9HYPH|nr:extracellular solute-binding protein [Labrys wisconsinensis]MDQ0471055.1 putative spermidine/putrescine transport system substrate-binding protein [Labrys wisconsinensis]